MDKKNSTPVTGDSSDVQKRKRRELLANAGATNGADTTPGFWWDDPEKVIDRVVRYAKNDKGLRARLNEKMKRPRGGVSKIGQDGIGQLLLKVHKEITECAGTTKVIAWEQKLGIKVHQNSYSSPEKLSVFLRLLKHDKDPDVPKGLLQLSTDPEALKKSLQKAKRLAASEGN